MNNLYQNKLLIIIESLDQKMIIINLLLLIKTKDSSAHAASRANIIAGAHMVFKMDQDMIKKDNKIMKIFESKITIKQG
jgi:hypothetical protein